MLFLTCMYRSRSPCAETVMGRSKVTEENPGSTHQDDSTEPIPFMQQLLDNPFLLLFLGVTIPAVLYIIWGVMEIVQIPIAK